VLAAVDWGPVAAWVGGVATICIAGVTALIALGHLSAIRPPRLALTFEPTEPWVRHNDIDGSVLWVRVAVENDGPPRTDAARHCVGRIVSVATDGSRRFDVDTVQLRWASVPGSRAFEPADIRNGQREFLDVVALRSGTDWRLITFDEPGHHPGYTLDLELGRRHVVEVAVFADNAAAARTSIVLEVDGAGETVVRKAT
jgi:hypothetical protein